MEFTLDHGMYLDRQTKSALNTFRAELKELVDDVGLVNEQQLFEKLPERERQDYWPWLLNRCNIIKIHGQLATKDSAKARVKSALISLGRPATCEEIHKICGFEITKIRSTLSSIPSAIRSDKIRWGLREWIDDEYEGIANEIVQRIKKCHGAANVECLLTELPEKFGVSISSVRASMQTSKFVVNDGWISLASKSSLRPRHLDDVIDGRNNDGTPFWIFSVRSSFFEGYSVPNVPPEIAAALGCKPDSGIRTKVENLPNCRPLSIRWSLSSASGASLGYLSDSLKCLGLKPGDQARLTIVAPYVVRLTRHKKVECKAQSNGAEDVLQRMIRRRQVL